MHDHGKSDGRVVPVKLPNESGQLGEEAAEGRRSAKGNAASEPRAGLSAGQSVSHDLDRVRRVAKRPLQRQNPRQEPGALNAHAGICAGGRQQWRSLPRP
jgi:hypothetical protein